MFCIHCFHPATAVTNSRPHKKQPSVWRRRRCQACRASFTTIEQPSLTSNVTVRGPNGTQPFNLGRLVLSIGDAFGHDAERGKTAALWLAQTVEQTLSSEQRHISSDDIEAVTHQVLMRFDDAAALQYAAKQGLITSVRRNGRA